MPLVPAREATAFNDQLVSNFEAGWNQRVDNVYEWALGTSAQVKAQLSQIPDVSESMVSIHKDAQGALDTAAAAAASVKQTVDNLTSEKKE